MPLVYQTLDEHLDSLIPKSDTAPYFGARYSLLGGGKRFRPKLVLALCDDEKALDAACAVEMIHAFSLIHDDLPCMDDDDFRRGKPTLHKVIGEGQALLAGDYLQTKAFDVIADSTSYDPITKIRLMKTLLGATNEMIVGQCMDINIEKLDQAQLEKLHFAKTGALIQASLLMGGILAGHSLHPLQIMGQALGLAYQLFDDIADDQTEHLGLRKTKQLANHYKNLALKLADDYPTLKEMIKNVG